MKLLRNVLVTLLVLILILTCVFLAGRYGWKILGFKACQGAWIETLEAGNGEVRLKGGYPGSFPCGFCGYVARQEGDTLYVGFHFSGLFGMFETGDFDITIPVEGELREIILKTNQNEFSIWTAEEAEAAEPETPAAYAAILSKYREALCGHWSHGDMAEQGLCYMAADMENPPEQVGYCVADLDGDGVPELVIATETEAEFYAKMVLDLYTLDGAGEAAPVFQGMERNRFYYAGDNRFASLGSSGWDNSYETTCKLEAGELIDMTYTTAPGDYVQLTLTPISRWGS